MHDDDRLIELEVKQAFQDNLLQALNDTIARQQKEIDLLQQQIRLLYRQVTQQQPNNGATSFVPSDNIPPHY